MTQLPVTPTEDTSSNLHVDEKSSLKNDTSTPATTNSSSGPKSAIDAPSSPQNTSTGRRNIHSATRPKPQRKAGGSPWCKALFYTIAIIFGLYVWLSWTDPDQIAMRQRAWDAAMDRIRGKQVVYANRYSKDFKYRPAASPIITESLSDGRTKIRGARHGDNIPVPKPTTSTPPSANRKKQRKRKGKKN